MRPTSAALRAGFLGLVSLVMLWLPAHSAEKHPVRPDFSGYQRLLSRYVVVTSGKGQPLDTRFDYEQLFVDERVHTLKRSDRLNQVRQQLLTTPASQLSEPDRRAWLLNLHNFLVIERATLHLLVPNRGFLRVKSVDEIFRAEGHFAEVPCVEFDAASYSIGRLERELIHGDTGDPWEPRATASDPRFLFALNRGLAGDAPILPWAFHGDSIEAQLDRATTLATSLPRIVRADAKLKRLELSNLFSEYRVDFGGIDEVRPWLEKHAARDVRRALNQLPQAFAPQFRAADRVLNQLERSKSPGSSPDSARVNS